MTFMERLAISWRVLTGNFVQPSYMTNHDTLLLAKGFVVEHSEREEVSGIKLEELHIDEKGCTIKAVISRQIPNELDGTRETFAALTRLNIEAGDVWDEVFGVKLAIKRAFKAMELGRHYLRYDNMKPQSPATEDVENTSVDSHINS